MRTRQQDEQIRATDQAVLRTVADLGGVDVRPVEVKEAASLSRSTLQKSIGRLEAEGHLVRGERGLLTLLSAAPVAPPENPAPNLGETFAPAPPTSGDGLTPKQLAQRLVDIEETIEGLVAERAAIVARLASVQP